MAATTFKRVSSPCRFNRALLLASLLIATIACDTPTPSSTGSFKVTDSVTIVIPPSPRQKPTHYVKTFPIPPDTSGTPHNYRGFMVGEQKFSEEEEFKTFITTLPRGSVVSWFRGCIIPEKLPLKNSKLTMKEFKAFCLEHGVEFRAWGGY